MNAHGTLYLDGKPLNSQLRERAFVVRVRHPTKRYWMRIAKKFTGDTAEREAAAWAEGIGGTGLIEVTKNANATS